MKIFFNKVFFLVISFTSLTLVLAACSGSGPSNAAKEWIEASVEGDGTTALKLTCEQYKSNVQTSGFLSAGLGLMFNIDMQDTAVDLSDLEFKVVEESGDAATVHVEGEMIVSLLGAAMPQQLDMDIKMVKEDGDWKFCG